MIDRTSKLAGIITGRGNTADFVPGARAFLKQRAHRRMRQGAKEEIRKQLDDMYFGDLEQDYADLDWSFDDYDDFFDFDWVEEEQRQKHQQRLARRRELYHRRKVAKQVDDYEQLVAALRKLESKLTPEARQTLSERGSLLG